MAKDEEYELLPHSEIAKLKEEIRRLKNPGDYSEPSGSRMDGSMEDLKESIDTLNEIFKEASMELRVGDSDLHTHLKKLANLSDKLDTIIDQNEKIAEAIVSVAESTDEIKQKIEEQRLTPPHGDTFKDFDMGSMPKDDFSMPGPPPGMPPPGGPPSGMMPPGGPPGGMPPPGMPEPMRSMPPQGGGFPGGVPPPGNPPGGPLTPPGALGPPQSGGGPLPPMPQPDKKKQSGMFGFR